MNRKLYDQHRERRLAGWRGLRRLFYLLAMLWSGMAVCRPATVYALIDQSASTGTTVITAHRLDFDNRQRIAVFEGDVVVKDDTLRLQSDKLTVKFDENEQPMRLEAVGNVEIKQENRLARSESAVYDIEAGSMVLMGSAAVHRGNDLLKGDTITFWRDEDRIEVQPGTLIISPRARGNHDLQQDIVE